MVDIDNYIHAPTRPEDNVFLEFLMTHIEHITWHVSSMPPAANIEDMSAVVNEDALDMNTAPNEDALDMNNEDAVEEERFHPSLPLEFLMIHVERINWHQAIDNHFNN